MKSIENYSYDTTKKPLGKGAFGTVYKGVDDNTGKEVAVKVIPTDILQNQDYSEILHREIEVLRQIKGENIVQMLSTKQTKNNLYIFMEFCNGGDIEAYLKKHGKMSEDKALEVAYQFCKAFNTINNLNIKDRKGNNTIIMHRDLKTANVLFHDGKIKIADFGFAKMVDETMKDRKIKHTVLGTPLYMAPQILDEQPYTSKCDIWSAGLIIYECIFGVLPWEAHSLTMLARKIKTQPLAFPSELREETKDLIQKMLEIHEAKRLSWSEMTEHPAIKAVEAKLKAQLQKPLKITVQEESPPKEDLMGKPQIKRAATNSFDKKPELTAGSPIDRLAAEIDKITLITDNREKNANIQKVVDDKVETTNQKPQTPNTLNRHTIAGVTVAPKESPEKTKKPRIFEEQKKSFDFNCDNNIRNLRDNIEYTPKTEHQKDWPPKPHSKSYFEVTKTSTTTTTTLNLDKVNPTTPTKKYLPIFSPIRKAHEIEDPFAPWKLFKELK